MTHDRLQKKERMMSKEIKYHEPQEYLSTLGLPLPLGHVEAPVNVVEAIGMILRGKELVRVVNHIPIPNRESNTVEAQVPDLLEVALGDPSRQALLDALFGQSFVVFPLTS
jgi:hypothetical protein